MRTALIALLSSVLLGLTCLPVAAQPNRKPDQAPGAAQMDAAKAAQLRTEIHQTMSALSEAQKASLPDQAKIKELNDNLAALRAQLWAGAARGHGPGTRSRTGRWDGSRSGVCWLPGMPRLP